MSWNLNLPSLDTTCRLPKEVFSAIGKVTDYGGRRHIFRDNGSSVLAVAHLDNVQPYKGGKRKGNRFYCATLDNRLGAYIILNLLPGMGIKPDVLLTDLEERGQSTAADFMPTKTYNWIFSFDRGGSDVVLYQYEDRTTVDLLRQSGFRVGIGSYSDIAELESLGVKGFNFGCGMHNYHSPDAYADLDELREMLTLFADFWKNNHTQQLTHKPQKWNDWGENPYSIFDELCQVCEVNQHTTTINYDGEELRVCQWCEAEIISYFAGQTTGDSFSF